MSTIKKDKNVKLLKKQNALKKNVWLDKLKSLLVKKKGKRKKKKHKLQLNVETLKKACQGLAPMQKAQAPKEVQVKTVNVALNQLVANMLQTVKNKTTMWILKTKKKIKFLVTCLLLDKWKLSLFRL